MVEIQKSVKMSEQAQFVRVGKMRCVATGRPVAQDHAEGPHRNLTDFPGALTCRRLSASDHRPSGNVYGSAVRDRDVNRDHFCLPVDHPTIANVSGTAREKSRRTICDFFSKKPKAT